MFLIFLPSALYFIYFLNFNNEYLPNKLYLFFVCLTAFSIFSFYDDVKNIHPIYRLIIQFFLILLSSPLFNLNEFPFENMIKLNLILYLYFYIYFLNIINFTDGTDGFLSVNSISFFIGVIILSIFENNFHFIELVSLIILPILLSFLIFNKPRAKLFMGDIKPITSAIQRYEYPIKDKDDNGFALIQSRDMVGSIHFSLVRWKNDFKLEVTGSEGSVVVDSLTKWGNQTTTLYERKYPSGSPKEKKYTYKDLGL